MVPEILLLVEQIRPRTTQIDDFGASIAILFKSRTFEAVESVGDALLQVLVGDSYEAERKELTYLAAAYDTLVLVVAEGAFIADAHEGGWANVRIADWAFAVAFVAEAADGNARLLAAHYEIAASVSTWFVKSGDKSLRMMARHVGSCESVTWIWRSVW
jgi:hypothetical protein